MAKIWLCRYGVPAGKGVLLADKPFGECVRMLRVNKTNHLGGVTAPVQFGNPEDALAAKMKGFIQVVVFLPDIEAKAAGWKAGYYHAPVTPKEAADRFKLKLPAAPAA